MGDAQPVEQSPEVVDVTAAQGGDRDRRVVVDDAVRTEQPRQHDLLGVALTEHHQPREVHLGKAWTASRTNLPASPASSGRESAAPRCGAGVQAQVSHVVGVDAAHHGRGVGGEHGLRVVAALRIATR